MSEYTDGILFLKHHLAEVETAAAELSQPYLFHEVNQKWGGIFIEELSGNEPLTRNWLLAASKQVPLFYFQHPADHGWGYNVFNAGKETASLWVSYELNYNMALDLAEIRYPNIPNLHVNFESDIFDSLLEEVRNSQEYQNAILRQYKNKQVAEFSAFDIDPMIIADLEEIVSANLYLTDLFEQVVLFKENLDINEMDWVSYRYLRSSK